MDAQLNLPGVIARDTEHNDLRYVDICLCGADESLQGRSHVFRERQPHGRGRQRHKVHDVLRVQRRKRSYCTELQQHLTHLVGVHLALGRACREIDERGEEAGQVCSQIGKG